MTVKHNQHIQSFIYLISIFPAEFEYFPPNLNISRRICEGVLCQIYFHCLLSGLFSHHIPLTHCLFQVASRRVFICTAIFYILIGVLAKVSAIVVSIPYPVLGGVLCTTIGVFVGVNLSNLQVVDLSSTRNLSIMGMAVFIGVLVPDWAEDNADAIDTGNYMLML